MRLTDANLTLVDLIRHGEPEGGRKFRGSTDHPLSLLGWSQMQAAVGEYNQWDAIVTSPLLRCCEFAHWLGDKHNIPVAVETDLAEMHLGDWEGLTMAEAKARFPAIDEYPDQVTAFWADPLHYPPQNGETFQRFDLRIQQVWTRILEAYKGQRVLIVAHLFTCNFIIRQVLQQPLEKAIFFDLPYAGLSRLRFEDTPTSELIQLEWVGRSDVPSAPLKS